MLQHICKMPRNLKDVIIRCPAQAVWSRMTGREIYARIDKQELLAKITGAFQHERV